MDLELSFVCPLPQGFQIFSLLLSIEPFKTYVCWVVVGSGGVSVGGGVDGGGQGGKITGNLGTRFPRNLKVSHEILIVNPAQLSRKCDTPKIYKKTILSHKKNHSCDRKFISCHRKFISCLRKSISCDRKFISRDRKFISCDRKFISCQGKFISCHGRIISCHRIFISCSTI